ncbi:hypothetical protein U1Q18_009241 [Sarracenia purpurea var. burkii]
MNQANPCRTGVPPSSSSSSSSPSAASTDGSAANSQLQPYGHDVKPIKTRTSVGKLVAENAVVVLGRRGCCMCHVVERLLVALGVNPLVVEVSEGEEAAVVDELSGILGDDRGCGNKRGGGGEGRLQLPAVFVRGKLFGGLERVMAAHISGELVPLLKEAGALWL